MRIIRRMVERCAVAFSAVLLLSATGGCATFGHRPGSEAFAKYVPAGGGMAPSMAGWAAPTVADTGTETNVSSAVLEGERLLRNGDRIMIQLRGITPPVEMADEIDEKGGINLEHIGQIVIAGMTTSEAERRIEESYIKGQYYKKISVTIVAERDDYFWIRGEVRAAGRYPLSRGMTLTMAIATAGGYTDYAKPTSVRILRGSGVTTIDVTQVEKRQVPDPLVQRGDNIIVDQRVF